MSGTASPSWNVSSLLALGSPEAISDAVRGLSEERRMEILRDFWEWANKAQELPEAPWDTWLFLAGRGAGKTKAGAEFVASMVAQGKARRVGLISETLGDAQAIMVEGPSGLLQVRARRRRPKLALARRRVIWPNGAHATWYSAEKPEQLRGPEFDLVWADEFVKWPKPQAVMDVVRFALRQGASPRMLVTTTPMFIPALIALKERKGVAVTHADTFENAANLSAEFVAAMRDAYAGTALERQELGGEILTEAKGALFRRAWLDAARVRAAPELARVVVAVDPAVTGTGRSDACGIIAAGLGKDGDVYVLGDHTERGLTPMQWAQKVAAVAEDYDAATVVAETNQGGDMVTAALKEASPDLKVIGVTAVKGKRARAESFIVPYERGRIHHVGALKELEDEMCLAGPDEGPSPDRLDALVWALTNLLPKKALAEPRLWMPGY